MGEVAIGAGEGAVLGSAVAVGCAATGPAVGACMGAAAAYGAYSLWESRGELATNPYAAARTIGGMATVVPSAKFTRLELAKCRSTRCSPGPGALLAAESTIPASFTAPERERRMPQRTHTRANPDRRHLGRTQQSGGSMKNHRSIRSQSGTKSPNTMKATFMIRTSLRSAAESDGSFITSSSSLPTGALV